MSIRVASHMARKAVTRDLSGQIINLIDETDGGWIIRNRQVVNNEKWQRMLEIEKDKREAALAATKAINNPTAPVADRNVAPSKTIELEKRVTDMESKLDAILKAVQK